MHETARSENKQHQPNYQLFGDSFVHIQQTVINISQRQNIAELDQSQLNIKLPYSKQHGLLPEASTGFECDPCEHLHANHL